jgi:hypothetical protein
MLVVDRLRAVLLPGGNPGLGREVRSLAWPAAEVRSRVDDALHQTAFSPAKRDQLLALALCWHDCWDDSHALAQAQEGDQDMDLVHAILHRREPDAANARYWLAQVGEHPAWRHLPPVAAAEGLSDLVTRDGRWRPREFVERCVTATAAAAPALVRIQAAELLALLDHLSRHPTASSRSPAIGATGIRPTP